MIDRAAILGEGRTLEVAKALGVAAEQSIPAADTQKTKSQSVAAAPGIEPLNATVRRHIEQALAHCNGRVEGPHGAAVLLKINPHTLRAKMRKLGIDWKRFRQADNS